MASPNPTTPRSFWRDAVAWTGSVTPVVLPRVLAFTLYALVVSLLLPYLPPLQIETSHIQYTGGVLVLLLVLRTNAGYERWWEARKLWGGIVNQSRNLAMKALLYGPDDSAWRERFVRWSAAFCHAARLALRSHRDEQDLRRVLADEAEVIQLMREQHLPSAVAARLGLLLRQARRDGALDGWEFSEIDRERAALIDHVGGCERILKTPLPQVHTIKMRRFILIYLLALPLVIPGSSYWLGPLATTLVAYPLLAIDQIGQELENPFSDERLSHLPLDAICATIEGNLMAQLDGAPPAAADPRVAGAAASPALSRS